MHGGSFLIAFLLNYVTLTVAIVAFVATVIALIRKRRTRSSSGKITLYVLLAVTVLYFLFVACAMIAIGNDPPFAYP